MEQDRREFIGGSDIAAVMAMSRWNTPLGLWMEKTGRIDPKDLSDNEAVELGSELEDFVARKFERKSGMKVRRPPVTHYTHKDHPWARAQVDRLIEGTDELLEVKTASAYKMKEWDGESIPQEYILQVYWQLEVTGRSVGWIAVLIGGQKFLYKKIDADKDFQRQMMENAAIFWSMVKEDRQPMAMYGDDDALLALHPNSNEQIQTLQEWETAVARRQELSGQIDALKEEKDEIEVKIKEAIGNNAGFMTEKYKVLWTPVKTSRVDNDSLKKAGLYDKYLKVTESRRLTIKLNKKEGK